ncbi:hypothetical protein SASPL_126424 [Salvia splendens]|uniref:DUF7036 domain-containing protein n=1 Tax=Salvia splendens TaxID=180675 RepID=A0A8X8XH72_SALSN|nr:hypothetical protein SASPL_126424 [Salvia splendens]
MGKTENLQPLEGTAYDAQSTIPGAGSSNGCCLSCSRVRKLVSLRCVLALVLGFGVLLSAVFLLPFFHFGDQQALDLDFQVFLSFPTQGSSVQFWYDMMHRPRDMWNTVSREGYDVVASFMLNKSVPFLSDCKLQLEYDIFDEIPFSNTKVEIIRLDPAGPNTTKVVFTVESDATTQSLIREHFVYLISNQSALSLTAPLFGDTFSFNVLKFKGGITASPDQKAFLLQSVKIPFNFTLNSSIDGLLTNFDELTSQLKVGLRLTPYEVRGFLSFIVSIKNDILIKYDSIISSEMQNLFIRLTNLKGSTVRPPTTVESQVVLAVGMDPSRLKQLAQTISGSHSKNLGLNNTEFGRVKQVRLSSILQHSLSNNGGSPSPSPSPSQSPMSKPDHHHRHHHHHHHHHHAAPAVSPSPSAASGGSFSGRGSPASTPAPAPAKTEPPCPFGHNNWYPWKHKHSRMAPTAPPVYAPHIAPSQPRQTDTPAPKIAPASAERPSPIASHAHNWPPSPSEHHARPLDEKDYFCKDFLLKTMDSADVYVAQDGTVVAAENDRAPFWLEEHEGQSLIGDRLLMVL